MNENNMKGRNDSPALKVDGDNVASSFFEPPLESLICAPLIDMAKRQQELTNLYLESVCKQAYKDSPAGTSSLSFDGKSPAINDDTTT